MEAAEFYRYVGKRIGEARRARKLTQQQLAAQVSLTRTSITNIEQGKQRLHLHTLWTIAKVLQVEPARLLPAQPRPGSPKRRLPPGLSPNEREWILAEVEVVAQAEGADADEVSGGGGEKRGHSQTVD